jgi:hypothetical protein
VSLCGAKRRDNPYFMLSLRGMPKASEAIPNGLASTIIPTNYNDHIANLGSDLVEASPFGIVTSLAKLAPHKDISPRGSLALSLSISLFCGLIFNQRLHIGHGYFTMNKLAD